MNEDLMIIANLLTREGAQGGDFAEVSRRVRRIAALSAAINKTDIRLDNARPGEISSESRAALQALQKGREKEATQLAQELGVSAEFPEDYRGNSGVSIKLANGSTWYL